MTPIDMDMVTNTSWREFAWMLAGGFALGLLFFGSLWISTSKIWFIALYREKHLLSSGRSSRYPGIHKPYA